VKPSNPISLSISKRTFVRPCTARANHRVSRRSRWRRGMAVARHEVLGFELADSDDGGF
jgi:hypothetical protein